MRYLSPAIALLFIILASAGVGAQEDEALKLRLAVAPLSNLIGDPAMTAVARAVTDSIGLTLNLVGSYRVETPPGLAGLRGLEAARDFAAANRLDALVLGTMDRDEAGSLVMTVEFFDRKKGEFTVARTEKAETALDVFDAADALTTGFLDALSGHHLGFGSLTLANSGEKADYELRIDGTSVGTNVTEVPKLLNGRHSVAIVQTRIQGELEIVREELTLLEDENARLSFALPFLTETERERIDPPLALVRNGLEDPNTPGFDEARNGLLAFLGAGTLTPRLAEIRAEVNDIGAKVEAERLRISVCVLVVTSEPPGMRIKVDGEAVGFTPQRLELKPGRHSVLSLETGITGTYYQGPAEEFVEIAGGTEHAVALPLTVSRGVLEFSNLPAGTVVYIDDVKAGVAPFAQIETSASRHGLRFEAPGVEPYSTVQYISPTRRAVFAWGDRKETPFILQRRTIKLDGFVDSWDGIKPYYTRSGTTFMSSADYGMSAVYMCRDDRYFYWRVDFNKTNPLAVLPKGTVDAIQLVLMNGDTMPTGGHLDLSVARQKSGNALKTWRGIAGSSLGWIPLGDMDIDTKVSPTMLVARLELAKMNVGAPEAIDFRVGLGNVSKGNWTSNAQTGSFWVLNPFPRPDPVLAAMPGRLPSNPYLPLRRQIQLDAAAASWAGVEPCFLPASQLPFMGSVGNGIKAVYMCRDWRYLYWRVDFVKTNPLYSLPAAVSQGVKLSLTGTTSDGTYVDMSAYRDKGSSEYFSWRGKSSPNGAFVQLGKDDLTVRSTSTSLVVRMEFSKMAVYLKGLVGLQARLENVVNNATGEQIIAGVIIVDFGNAVSAGAETIYLSDMSPTSVSAKAPPLTLDRVSSKTPLVLGGVEYPKGLFSAAPATVVYKLDKKYSSFEARIGLFDAGQATSRRLYLSQDEGGDVRGAEGEVVYQVFVDGKKAFDSGPMGWKDERTLSVPVVNARELKLVVLPGASTSGGLAIWADARLLPK